MSIVQHNIRAFRKKLGYTQEEVAAVLGVTRPKYTEYETREMDVPEKALERLGQMFGTDASTLKTADQGALRDALVCAYRTDSFSEADRLKIERFNRMVGTYVKMIGKER